MGFWSWFFDKPQVEQRLQQTPVSFEEFGKLYLGGLDSDTGLVVSSDSALQVSAVLACVRLIAETMSCLPGHVYQRTNAGRERQRGHKIERTLRQPNEFQNRSTWIEAVVGSAVLTGNGYSFVADVGDRFELRPLDPHRTRAHRPNGRLVYRTWVGNEAIDLEPFQVIHLRGLPGPDGIHGIDPISKAARSIGIQLAADKYSAKFFANGAKMSGYFTSQGKLSDDARRELKSGWAGWYGGVEHSHETPFLPFGIEFHPVSVEPEKTQLLELMKWRTNDIARLFRVPPHLIGDLEQSTNNNIEHQGIEFVKYSLAPWVKRLEEEVCAKLLLEEEKNDGYFYELVVDGLERGDITSRYNAYASAIQNGWRTRNEIRELENLNKIDGLDSVIQPLNIGTVQPEAEADEEPAADEERHADFSLLFADAFRRISTKEMNAVKRAIKRHEDDDLLAWIDEFYGNHEQHVRSTLMPVVTTWARATNNSAQEELDTLVTKFTADCRNALIAASCGSSPQKAFSALLQQWEQRPASEAEKYAN